MDLIIEYQPHISIQMKAGMSNTRKRGSLSNGGARAKCQFVSIARQSRAKSPDLSLSLKPDFSIDPRGW